MPLPNIPINNVLLTKVFLGGPQMILKSLQIENFRNFDNVTVKLSNQNVIFGMNDMGKTNLMFALRFLLDRKYELMGSEKLITTRTILIR